MERPAPALRTVALVQGLFYLITGFWPVLEIRSFQWVTGRKTDLWLVKTAGALIGVIGVALTFTGRRGEIAPELPLLGAGSAASLAAIDLVYVRRGTIGKIYLLDAAAELGLVGAWLLARRGAAR